MPRLAGASDRSSASSFSGVSDFSLGPPPDLSDSANATGTSVRGAWVPRLLTQPLLFALAGGIGFGSALGMVRGLAPDRFDGLLGGTTPLALGCAAFLLLFALQVAATVAGRRR